MSQYSPHRRTALVFCGSGAHGAYHAGALRALHEAGVKIDVVAGHGGGVVAALFAAIDGGSRLWEADGLWRSAKVASFYSWKRPLRAGGYLAALLVGVLLTPLFILAAGFVVYPAGFVLGLLGTDIGASLIAWYSGQLQTAFSGPYLPTVVPRVAMLVLAALAITCLAGASRAGRRALHGRRQRGRWWWQLAGAPLDATTFRAAVLDALWQPLRGGGAEGRPSGLVLGRRYADVLQESIGQPGFRELVLVASDIDSRADVVAALLREPYRGDFLAPLPGRERMGEALDLAGSGRDHLLDIACGALIPPVSCDPQPITFAGDSFWRGETHRLSDRSAAVARLLEELGAAGVSQVIIVSAVAGTAAPHRLSRPRLDLRGRLGELLEAAEAAALRDAVENARLRFDAIFIARPAHNPLGPFDFSGAYDEASDRHQSLRELMALGYEDVYRQFIEPIVGSSGEQLAER